MLPDLPCMMICNSLVLISLLSVGVNSTNITHKIVQKRDIGQVSYPTISAHERANPFVICGLCQLLSQTSHKTNT